MRYKTIKQYIYVTNIYNITRRKCDNRPYES